MGFLKKIDTYYILRIGFGFSYLYSGSSMFLYPSKWYGFMPSWFSQELYQWGFTVSHYLKVQGILEVLAGFLFFMWFFDRFLWGRRFFQLMCFLVALQMALILVFTGLDPITFRDIVLMVSAIALLSMSFQRYGSREEA